ncbi:MAG: Peptide chain release factor subunit 1 [Candidatus Methanogaster sp.]|nr:MAG: Peptide chain release factor subunit 1 [ANME-2 cluster archaeon]
MKIRRQKLKRREGVIELVPETLDDLWHLKYIIENHDLVSAFTKRRVEGATDKIRPEAAEKKSVHLTIEVFGMEFHRFSNRLRVRGVIRSGVDTGEYHTINIEIGSMVGITKHWKPDQLERIAEAKALSDRPRVTIITVESGEAEIGRVRQFGVDRVSQVTKPSGKQGGDFTHEFFASTTDALNKSVAGGGEHAIIIAGPGFIKEDFMEYLRSTNPDIAARAVLEDTVSTGMPGFIEVLRRGAVDRIVQESRIGRETEMMDALMREISTDGKCAYGIVEVMAALELGAIETLLIVDETLRNFREAGSGAVQGAITGAGAGDEMGAGAGRGTEEGVGKESGAKSGIDADDLLRRVEQMQGRVVVLSSEFEPGNRLDALGGMAALLRFKIE